MSADPHPPSQALSEQNKEPHLLQTPTPTIHAGDVVEGVKGGAGDAVEQPEESTAPPLASSIDASMPQLPPPLFTPLPKKGHRRRKKNPLTPRQRANATLRLKTLTDSFRPVSFSPGKTLDFSAHENLFRALGLWDFAHLDLYSEVRSELLVDLIAYYDHASRRSYVRGERISVNRSGLARALCLPAKKEKAITLKCTDEDVCVLLEFISNYMPYGDDMCILPSEIMQAIQLVKERLPQKVEWAALMWVLVEKELLDAPKSRVCHCASHLQCLIKYQLPHLFQNKGEPVLEADVDPEGEEVLIVEEVHMADDEGNALDNMVTMVKEDDDYSDKNGMKMRTLEDSGNMDLEENNGKLPLTLGEEENVMGGFEEEKVGEDEKSLEVKIEGFVQPCSSGVAEGINFENFTDVNEQEGQEMKCGDDLSTKFSNLDRLYPSDLLQAMGNTLYSQQLNSFNATAGDIMTMGADSHQIKPCHGPSGYLYSVNNGKRHAMDDLEEDQFKRNQQKRMRNGETWGNLPLSSAELMEHMLGNAEKVKVLYAEKNQSIVKMQMQVQYLSHILQEKEQAVCSLKIMMEEQQHWRMVVRHYEHELDLMTKMLFGYKKALKETQVSFSDYKRNHLQDDGTLYKDVLGTSDLIPSVREFEQHKLEKEDARQKLLDTFVILEKVLLKFKECEKRIIMHNRKLVELAGEVKKLKERFVKSNSTSI